MEHCSPLPHFTSKTRGGESVATTVGTCPLAGGKSLGETWQRWQHSANLPYRWLAPCSPLFSGHDPSVSQKEPGHEAIHPSQPPGAPQTPQPPGREGSTPRSGTTLKEPTGPCGGPGTAGRPRVDGGATPACLRRAEAGPGGGCRQRAATQGPGQRLRRAGGGREGATSAGAAPRPCWEAAGGSAGPAEGPQPSPPPFNPPLPGPPYSRLVHQLPHFPHVEHGAHRPGTSSASLPSSCSAGPRRLRSAALRAAPAAEPGPLRARSRLRSPGTRRRSRKWRARRWLPGAVVCPSGCALRGRSGRPAPPAGGFRFFRSLGSARKGCGEL